MAKARKPKKRRKVTDEHKARALRVGVMEGHHSPDLYFGMPGMASDYERNKP